MPRTTLYVRIRVVPGDFAPGSCRGCGIVPHTMFETTREDELTREEVGDLAERPENCPGCGRMIAVAVDYEVEE